MMRFLVFLGCLVMLAGSLASGQQGHPDAPSASQQQSGQLPDAPSPQQPKFPKATETPAPRPSPESEEPGSTPAPPPQIVPANPQAPRPEGVDSRNDMFKIGITVNQVYIPVTVRDSDGHLVEGLLRKDFRVLENGLEQNLNFFTSDPFPLTAAVVLDTAMAESEMRKVNETMGALTGAFSAFDEVAFYTYGKSVKRELDYSAMNERFSLALRRIKPKGQSGGVAVTSGPMGPQGPMVNGIPVEPSQSHVYTPPRESYVLNDAILMAARDLQQRDPTRRKIIFVLSDGKESGSRATFDEVRKVLLSSAITVYALGLGEAGLPVYRSVEKVHVPYTSFYGNILGRYARDTGGDVFPEVDRGAIETAYQRVTTTARNQYTLGYKAKANASGSYRSIEVKVLRGGLTVQAKPGYFPLPPKT